VRTLLGGTLLVVIGVPTLLVANAHQPEYECNGSISACEHGRAALTPIPGRFSEGADELAHAIAFGLIGLGVALMLVGIVMLVRGARGAS
jgi:hypothetical protein